MVKILGRHRRHEMDMTTGSIAKNLFTFAVPLLIGNLFQQLYNMVDTWVIGQTGDSGAYAAVGSVGPIINIMIGIFSGLASGAGVVISRYFGAKEPDKVKRAVHTSLVMTILFSVLFTAVGVLLTPLSLRLMLGGEGGEIFDAAVTYLTIYFAGIAGLLFTIWVRASCVRWVTLAIPSIICLYRPSPTLCLTFSSFLPSIWG